MGSNTKAPYTSTAIRRKNPMAINNGVNINIIVPSKAIPKILNQRIKVPNIIQP